MQFLLFLLIPFASFSQFHISVEANPDNHREVNVAWKNNYVVTYTNDNWAKKIIIKGQLTYQGYDDNGKPYFTSYYQQITFEKQGDAMKFAKKFKSYNSILNYDMNQLTKHMMLSKQYKEENKKLCFGCKDRKNEKPKPVLVY